MSRGTEHNRWNRQRQRAKEDAEFEGAKPGRITKAYWEKMKLLSEKARADAKRGRLDVCSLCRESFRSTSQEVGIFLCPKCRANEGTDTRTDTNGQ